jgi:prepilin-type N-terminal cleavage/methylation domain-containing protein
MTLKSYRRGGFTLIELMVVIGVITFLAGLAMLVVPTVLEKDRTTDAVTMVEGWLQNAKLRALRDKAPRGVRFIVNQNLPPYLCTEAQYIEVPPILVLGDGPGQYPLNSPRVVFTYGLDTQFQLGGQNNPRRCDLQNIDNALAAQLVPTLPGSTLIMPVLDQTTAFQIVNVLGQGQGNAPNTSTITVQLDQYPDAQLGAGASPAGSNVGTYVTYHFGITGQPRPLLGEPVMQLPTNTAVDVTSGVTLADNVSQPGYTGPLGSVDYDILFAPSGQTISVSTGKSTGAAGQIFLWVRDYRKVPTMQPSALGWANFPTGPAPAAYMDALRNGGEQMIVVVKGKSGGVGAAPIYWPDANSSDVYLNARRAVSGP